MSHLMTEQKSTWKEAWKRFSTTFSSHQSPVMWTHVSLQLSHLPFACSLETGAISYPCRGTANSVGSQRGGCICSLCAFSPQSSISKPACPTECREGDYGKGGLSMSLKRDHTSLSLCFNSKGVKMSSLGHENQPLGSSHWTWITNPLPAAVTERTLKGSS